MSERPKVLTGPTVVVTTGCGHLYVTVNSDGGPPQEIFARLGKAGGCSNSQNEALTRAISLGLKSGISAKEYIEELRNLRCPNPNLFPEEEECLSCADGIARVLEAYVGEDKKGT